MHHQLFVGPRMYNPSRNKGITLIELMVVVAIVAVLGTIAVSSYRSYLLRTNRTEAKMALLRVQAAQEKFFLQQRRYASNAELDDAPPDGLGVDPTTPGQFYTISLDDVDENVEYLARATAINGQAEDTAACQVLTINERGQRSPAEDSGCWR